MGDGITSLAPVRWRALAAVALAVGATACDRDEESQSADVQMLVAVVRDAAEQAPPREDPDELPVVYVVSSADEGIEPKVQASVANTLNGEIDVRFADARSEAVDDEQPGQPVRDHGCLVQMGELPTDIDPVDVEVEFYRSETEFSVRVLTFSESGDAWSMTSSSVLEELDVPPTTAPPGAGEGEGEGDAGPVSASVGAT